jgi:hypothetical protein
MAITEEEAQARWCPYAVVDHGGATHNRIFGARPHEMAPGTQCLGSICMAWRQRAEPAGYTEQVVVDDPTMGPGGKRLAPRHVDRVVGWCGLAGEGV